MNNIVILAIQLAVAVGAFALGKYVFPNIPKNVSEKLQELSGWAAQFVVWAREFMKTSTGKEKMDKVVEQLKERTAFLKGCTKYGNNTAEQQDKSYSTMMMYELKDLVDDLIEIVKGGGVNGN